jgi:hypothetical protein
MIEIKCNCGHKNVVRCVGCEDESCQQCGTEIVTIEEKKDDDYEALLRSMR